ncbi:MAG: hypothetical protein JWQ72_2236, partial [Polaromonas sp.]|nr:hypothetical protein [Polaromonas sp.]
MSAFVIFSPDARSASRRGWTSGTTKRPPRFYQWPATIKQSLYAT